MLVQSSSLRSSAALVIAALLLALLPALAGPAAAADAVVTATGFDRLPVGRPGDVVVTVTAPSNITPTTPLRIVGTFTGDSVTPTIAAVLADGLDPLEIDAAGRFVVPAEDQAPLTLAANPALATGLDIPLQITLPDGADRDLSLVLAQSNEGFATLDRFAGADRFATAAQLSAATFAPGVDVVYVARSDNFADALAAGPGAGLGGNPVLLTATNDLPKVTQDELTRLAPGRIVVLGGTVAISDAVLTQLRGFTDGEVTRLAGEDRYLTAAAVARDAFTTPRDTVVVASGENFPDALAGGAFAATIDAPVLLVRKGEVPGATTSALEAFAPTTIVVLGGPDAIADEVVATLDGIATGRATRIAGGTRYETATKISLAGFEPASTPVVYIATGENFPDALAGVPPAVLDGAPLLLVRRDEIPAAVAAEIERLGPTRVVVLGGDQVIGPDVIAALTLLARDRAPSRDDFTPLTTTAVELRSLAGATIVSPTTVMPSSLRPGDRTAVAVDLPEAGDVVVSLVEEDGDVVTLANPTATATVPEGPSSLAINAPLVSGTYDVRVEVTTSGVTTTTVEPDALSVGITFPPPLISGLIEGVDGQSQLLAVRPAGGLEEGTTLTISMSSAEQDGVDYPAAGAVTVLVGSGTATLVVARDGTAAVRYVAGPTDRVPGDDPTAHPLLTFRIDDIDVDADAAATHVGSFFRDDIGHGVSRTFTVGAGSDIARPAISSLQRGSDHTFQTIRVGLPAPIEPNGSFTIDLSDAEVGAADYSDAFAFFNGGGHGDDDEGPFLDVAVELDVVAEETAVLTVTALEEGIPSVNGEGPFIDLFIGGIVVDDVEADPQVVVTRQGGALPLVTSFHVGDIGLVNPTASDLAADTADQDLVLSVELAGAMEDGSGLEVVLPPIGTGTDFTDATVTLTGGSGEALLFQYSDDLFGSASLSYFSAGDASGTVLTFTLSGVDTTDGDHTSRVSFYRYESGAEVSTTYDVGAGAALIDPVLIDLASDESAQSQFALFSPTTALAAGQTVTIDLSSAEAGGVSYGGASVVSYGVEDNSTATIDVVDGTSAVVVVTAGDGGLPAGEQIYLDLSNVAADAVLATYPVTFTRQGAPAVTSSFRVRRIPGVRNVTATDLEAGQLGQTQTFSFEIVGDLEAFNGLYLDLSTAEQGAVAYGGASVDVTSGNAIAELNASNGGYAEVYVRPGDEDLADGSVVTIDLVGVNTQAIDETHAVQIYRFDSGRSFRAIFDVGAGSPFIGGGFVDSLFVSPDGQYQGLGVELATPLAAGQSVTMDLTAATSGVDYTGATVADVFGAGMAEIIRSGGSTKVVYTATGTTQFAYVALDGVVADTAGGPFEVTFVDDRSGRTARSTFEVYDDFDHGG